MTNRNVIQFIQIAYMKSVQFSYDRFKNNERTTRKIIWLNKFAIKVNDNSKHKYTNTNTHWFRVKPISIEIFTFSEDKFIVIYWCVLFHFDQTIPSMSQMMKNPNRNQKQIIKPHKYCRCQILCLPHRYTITHKKRCTKQAHVYYSWPWNGPKICPALLSSLFVIRWERHCCYVLFCFSFHIPIFSLFCTKKI